MRGIVEERGQLWIDCYSAFVLQVPDFNIETFDLPIEKHVCFLAEPDFLRLKGLCTIELRHAVLDVGFVFRKGSSHSL